MNINVYSYPEGIDFRKIETRIAHKSKMKYLYSLDMNLTTEGRYYKKVKKYLITFPPELNNILEQLMEREVEDGRLKLPTLVYPKFIFEIEINDIKHYFHNNPWFVGEVFVEEK